MKVEIFGYKKWMTAVLFLMVSCIAAFAQPTISASRLYMEYESNGIKFEMDYAGKTFYLTGKVSEVARGFLGGYVVRLDVPDTWVYVTIVYPMNIPSAVKEEISEIEQGEMITVLVKGRNSYSYVDAVIQKEENRASSNQNNSSSGKYDSYGRPLAYDPSSKSLNDVMPSRPLDETQDMEKKSSGSDFWAGFAFIFMGIVLYGVFRLSKRIERQRAGLTDGSSIFDRNISSIFGKNINRSGKYKKRNIEDWDDNSLKLFCRACGAEVTAGTKFCTSCGARGDFVNPKQLGNTTLFCRKCGAGVNADTKFCTSCGARQEDSSGQKTLIGEKSKEYCYDVLGIPRYSSVDEVKRAYRQLAVMYHPDKNPGNASALEKFREITDACKTLLNIKENFMPFCTNCGADITEELKFCMSCGKPINRNVAV